MPTVRFTRAGAVEIEVKLDQLDLRLGRASDNDVALQDPDKTLSRHHAEFRREGDRWFYLDLNSANGTWIGDRHVTRQELTPGLSMRLGDYQLTVAEVPKTADAGAGAGPLEATYMVKRQADTVRHARAEPTAAPKPAAGAPPAAAQPANSLPGVGGAVSRSAAPAPGPRASASNFRRIIIYGAIAVFGAFAIMLALLLAPDTAPPEETAAAPAAPAATAVPATGTAAQSAPAPAPVPATDAPAPGAAVTQTATATPAAPPESSAPSTPPAAANPVAAVAPVAPPVAPPKPRVIRDTDPDASSIPARPGEDPSALKERRDDIRRRYALGLQRLSAQQFVEARELFAGVAGDAPKFRDVGARMADTEARMRQQAGEGFKAAAKLEEAGEWSDALAAYERLRPYAASLSGLTDAIERTRKRMHEAGAEALTRARQFDSRGRVPEAIAWYQRAVKWLPPDHPGLPAAKKRLAELVSPA